MNELSNMMDSTTEPAPVTRIFVSGLPPSMTTEQLRSHFSSKFTVTDSHVVADRRIGFLGFMDHETAKSAVKYFNRSFVKMSKISVTLAKPVELKRDASGQAAPISLRRSCQAQDSQEYHLKKRKREARDDGEMARQHNSQVQQEKEGPSAEITRSDAPPGTPDPADNLQAESPIVQASDSDWLRGKTSRLLDLIEGEDPNPDVFPRTVEAELDEPADPFHTDPQEDSAKPVTDEDGDQQTSIAISIPNARLFVRNLPFNASESSVREAFSPYGRISEVHLVTDTRTSTGKGLGYVQFIEPSAAERALIQLDGKAFQGRLMHILPASDKKTQKLNEFEISKLPLKQQKALKRKSETTNSTFSWNSLYMNPDAVLASVANRLGVTKSDLLDPSSSNAAVKQAHAETSVIKETKTYLASQGMNLEAFTDQSRDDCTLLLKNFSYGTTSEELSQMLSQYGNVSRLVFPPTGTMAVVQYEEPSFATLAMKQLAYRNLKGSVLYLERAPKGIWMRQKSPIWMEDTKGDDVDMSGTPSATLFVRNLNFTTSTTRLAEAFKPLSGFLSARVKTRTDAKRPGEVLSMGFGFVEFRTKSQADAAIAAMNGRMVEGHEIIVQASQKSTDAAEERRKDDASKKANAKKTKIIIKNLPFEATKKDIRALFGAYGKLRTVRLPRKFDNTARGFAFAEFVTAKEAENAMDALENTHLLGRRLVLDFAEGENIAPEDEIRAMEKKVQSHQNILAHHKLTGSARKKFNADAARDDAEPL
ncbi:hypothetical protein LTR84_006679 [Exophiala bonariae]|uniref:Multiple RNA-binding domain-containing protein 1 n=1 Tax=Exophiala bonariae TaxID=1690606 RepID=A0AAV9N3G4_9EURO|nr:hypothetical protein LTR84_006679 [Exophiala bonariae]